MSQEQYPVYRWAIINCINPEAFFLQKLRAFRLCPTSIGRLASQTMASAPHAQVPGLAQEMGGNDGALTFDEARQQVSGNKLSDVLTKPIATFRELGEVSIGDWPLRLVAPNASNKLEQFVDGVLHHPGEVSKEFFDDLVKLCAQGRYSDLPAPFCLKKEPTVPDTMQTVIVPVTPPHDEPDEEDLEKKKYHHIMKHVYLHKNKLTASVCSDMCQGVVSSIDYGTNYRAGLLAFNFMIDKTGGKQIRYWVIKPKFEKKASVDQSARAAGYAYIREKGPRNDNMNQFMEWADEKINDSTSLISGWQEGRVKEALRNYQKGRQNAKTITYWPFTLKSMVAWFLNDVLVKMLGSMRMFAITWIGTTRTGKSLGSKITMMAQSRFEIDADDMGNTLVPSIVTAKFLDFFKAENITKYKPGGFDDGVMHKQDCDRKFLSTTPFPLYSFRREYRHEPPSR